MIWRFGFPGQAPKLLSLGPRLPTAFQRTCRKHGVRPTRFVLAVQVNRQRMWLFEKSRRRSAPEVFPKYEFRKRFTISTSRLGAGQKAGSNQTPLGLHRIAEKIGGGYPIGTVFQSRQAIGLTWSGLPDAPIAHRILWLAGLEPSINSGGDVDSHSRYIYIHGTGDETTLGRPASRGCIHVAASDLLALFDRVPSGTLVWIEP